MRIVNRKEFLSLPENTLFRKFQPDIFYDLEIKKCNSGYMHNDFLSQGTNDIYSSSSEERDRLLDQYVHTCESFKLTYDFCGRDGCFDGKEVMFAIYENEDINELIEQLKLCKK